MPYCSACGTEVSADASFCQDCGTELETRSTTHSPDVVGADHEQEPESGEGINWRNGIAAAPLAVLPAFGAYMGVSIAANDAFLWVFFVAIPVFGYLLYQRPTVKAMVGGTCFWLAIETFLTPFFLLVYTVGFASQEMTTGAAQAGAAIGGFLIVVAAFVVGVPTGIVLYLISRRLDIDGAATASE